MPQRHEHLAKAEQTEGLAHALNHEIPVCVDWAVTMLFYAALHYIDAFLAGKNLHPLDHTARDEEVEKNGSISDIYKDYRRLKDMSRRARYEVSNLGPADLETAKARLSKIKTHISGII